MGRALRNEFGMSRKSRIGIAVILAGFLITTIVVFENLHNHIKEVIMEESENDIANTSALNRDAIYKDLENRQILLKSIGDSISSDKSSSLDRILEKMKFYSDNYSFYNMGVMTLDGILHTVKGNHIDVAQVSPFCEALKGKTLISKSVAAADDGNQMINILSVPVYRQSELVYILAAAYLSRDLAQNLNISAMEDKGFSFILDEKGKGVIFPMDGNGGDYMELLEYIDGNEDISPPEMVQGKLPLLVRG